MDALKKRGFHGVRFLVNKANTKAIRSYAGFGFRIAGECRLYEQDLYCYEKAL
jgi:ribosomal protein S18 acetylase RimI-like enzyme